MEVRKTKGKIKKQLMNKAIGKKKIKLIEKRGNGRPRHVDNIASALHLLIAR